MSCMERQEKAKEKITMQINGEASKKLRKICNLLRDKGYKARSVSPGKIVSKIILKDDVDELLSYLEEKIGG